MVIAILVYWSFLCGYFDKDIASYPCRNSCEYVSILKHCNDLWNMLFLWQKFSDSLRKDIILPIYYCILFTLITYGIDNVCLYRGYLYTHIYIYVICLAFPIELFFKVIFINLYKNKEIKTRLIYLLSLSSLAFDSK